VIDSIPLFLYYTFIIFYYLNIEFVLQWTWAATILQSSNVAWEYGVSGPFWYASGATIQVWSLYYEFNSYTPSV
jgi:hypothetical protein